MARGHRRSAEDDAAFRARIDAARDRRNLSDIVSRYMKLKRAGRELKALCPFHSERSPSFQVNDDKGFYHCFGCGAHGDALRFLQHIAGLSFMDALRDLEDGTYPEVTPAERAQRAAEDAADRERAIDRARAVAARSVPAEGTPAEVYIRGPRGIIAPIPPSIRFARTPVWYNDDTGECGPDVDALIGLVTNNAAEIVGVQRIFLADGGRAKARMKKAKLSLGRPKGGALRLDSFAANCGETSEVIITEGPEDGLSLAQEMPDRRVWVALGTAFMPEIEFLPNVRSIVIAGQNDGPGRAAVENAALALVERGYDVRTMYPDPAFKDWNDQLRGIRI